MDQQVYKMKPLGAVFSILIFLLSIESAAGPYGKFSDWLSEGKKIPKSLIESLSRPEGPSFAEAYLGFESRSCPTSEISTEGLTVAQLFFAARALDQSGDYCEAAHTYLAIRLKAAYEPYWSDVGIRAIISYIRAGDHLEAINEANDVLDVVQNVQHQAETVQLLALVTVLRKMREHRAENSQEWTRYLLGIDGQQISNNTYLIRLSLRAFEKNFPQSEYNTLINSWKQEARDLFGAHYLSIGKVHQQEENYLSAILSFQNVLRAGPAVKAFGEVAYETVRSYLQFSKQILYSNRLTDQELRDWMRLPPEMTLNRKQVGRDTRNEAVKIVKLLEQNMPENIYTKKAAALLVPHRLVP